MGSFRIRAGLYGNAHLCIQRIVKVKILNTPAELNGSVPIASAVLCIADHHPLAVDGNRLLDLLERETVIFRIIVRNRDLVLVFPNLLLRHVVLCQHLNRGLEAGSALLLKDRRNLVPFFFQQFTGVLQLLFADVQPEFRSASDVDVFLFFNSVLQNLHQVRHLFAPGFALFIQQRPDGALARKSHPFGDCRCRISFFLQLEGHRDPFLAQFIIRNGYLCPQNSCRHVHALGNLSPAHALLFKLFNISQEISIPLIRILSGAPGISSGVSGGTILLQDLTVRICLIRI